MKMKDGRLKGILENDDTEYTQIEEDECSVQRVMMKRHFAHAVSTVHVG